MRSIAVSHGTRDDVLRLFDVDPGAGARHPQRHRCGLLPPRSRDRCFLERHGVDPSGARTSSSSGASRARRGSSTSSAPSATSTPGIGVVLCAGPAGHARRSRREMAEGVARGPGGAAERGLDRRDGAAARTCASCTRTPRSSAAHRSTSRSGSSTSRRPPARRRSWPPPSAASPRSSSTGRPGCSCRSSCRPTTRWRPIDPDRFEREPGRSDQRAHGRCPAAPGGAWAAPARRRAVEAFSWDVDRPPDGGPVRVSGALALGPRRRGHEGQGVALAVIEERHPLLGAVVVGVDEVRRAGEVDASRPRESPARRGCRRR